MNILDEAIFIGYSTPRFDKLTLSKNTFIRKC